jgi:two-component system, OmpR family, phosphate regulon response regulator PhoB
VDTRTDLTPLVVTETDRPVALVVDDDPDTGALIAYTLERGGWSVRQARDGEQAVMLAREHVPRVVVLDLALPRMSGLGVLRTLKSWKHQTTPVVVVSAFGSCTYLPILRRADAIVKKPFSPSDLLQQVNRVADATWRAPRP